MRKIGAGCFIAGWVVILGCTLTACSQAGSIATGAASSAKGIATSAAAAVTGAAATTTAAAPTTAPPTTAAPTTAAPTTAAPTTAAPTTAAPTTAAPTTAAPTTSPSPGTSTSSLTWLWVALAVVAAIIIIALIASSIARSHRRRADAAASWQAQLVDAYAKGAALHDAMAAAEAPGALSSPDAPARWYDIQRRADDYTQLLYALRENATDEEERARIADVLAALQAARSAMEAERSAGGADMTMANVVRDRLSFFASALQELRGPNIRPA